MAKAQDLVSQGFWPEQAKLLSDDQFLTPAVHGTVAAGSTLTANTTHVGKVILLDTAAGSTVTLPAATGTGDVYRFKVSVAPTSNNHIVKVANATDVMRGTMVHAGATGVVYATLAASDTITMSGTTTGGALGTEFTLRDIASGFWSVSGFTTGSSTAATPFSASVS